MTVAVRQRVEGQAMVMTGPWDPAHLAHIVEELARQPEEQYTAQTVVDRVVQSVPGCDACGISMRRSGGKVETPASTGETASALDAAQYELNEGPCLDALWESEIFVCTNTATETRWPSWSPVALQHGIRSVLSVRLVTDETTIGSINIYGEQVDAFDDSSVDLAAVYARLAAVALMNVRESTGLRSALQSRLIIGVAQGMLMERYGLTLNRSFEVLRRRSQETNTKLRDVAQSVVDGRSITQGPAVPHARAEHVVGPAAQLSSDAG